MSRGTKHLTSDQKSKILERYSATLDAGSVAEELSVSISQVWHLLKKNGIALSGCSGGACYRRIDDVRKWALEGISMCEIARRIGTSHSKVGAFLRKHSIPYKPFRQAMENNCFWRGGRVTEQPEGYILVKTPDHPYANHHGYVREHRLVMEKKLGRYLDPKEIVHHKDDNPSNNHIDNLELFESNAKHLAKTLKGKCPNWTPEGRAAILKACRQNGQKRRIANRSASTPDDARSQQTSAPTPS